MHTRAKRARLLDRRRLMSSSELSGHVVNRLTNGSRGIALERFMGAEVPDLTRADLRWVNTGDCSGLSRPIASQKHAIAADVFLSADSGRGEASAILHKKSAIVIASIPESEPPRSWQNSARRCSCLLYVSRVDLAQQSGSCAATLGEYPSRTSLSAQRLSRRTTSTSCS